MPPIPVIIVAIFFALGGFAHFIFTDFFVAAMPDYLPWHRDLVYISGIFELLGAAGILVPETRKLAGYGLIILCLAVFPANINMAINAEAFPYIPEVFLWLRLPFQPVFIVFIWWAMQGVQVKKVMQSIQHESLEEVFKALSSAFDDILEWKWDSRFKTVLAEYNIDKLERVEAILESHFEKSWNKVTIENAPDNVLQLNSFFGGLKGGQRLMTSNPNNDVFIFAVIWPWGSGKTVSIRVGSSLQALDMPDRDKHIEDLKHWFNLVNEDSGWKIGDGSTWQ